MKTRNPNVILALVVLLVAQAAFTQEPTPVVPQVTIVSPLLVVGQHEAVALPDSPVFRIRGAYADESADIWFYRTLLKPALLPDGTYVDTHNDFANHEQFVAPFDDAAWTVWQVWDLGNDEVEVAYSDLPRMDELGRTIYYVFAAQIMASDGTVSIRRDYGYDVANFRVTSALAPTLVVRHPLLGQYSGAGSNLQRTIDLLAGLEGDFTWEADADGYGGEITSYRWGWDITDPDDPDDPGWALPPGLSDAHRRAGPIPFTSGIHTLTIRAVDSYGGVSRWLFVLSFVPVPEPQDQLPLLLVDDVPDRNSNAWPSQSGLPLDRDGFRDEFWRYVLEGSGGVAGFDPDRDTFDTADDPLTLRDIVEYRSLIWTGRWAASSAGTVVGGKFRPGSQEHSPIDLRYVWLGAYQEQVGNLLLCGDRSADNFLPESAYMLPIVFESTEGDDLYGMAHIGGVDLRVGFGLDESGEPIYPRLYPYRNLGLAALDVVSPTAAYYTPAGDLIRLQRKNACVGVKGLALDQDFVQNHMGGAAAFADTIWTEATIDWQDDPFPAGHDVLDFVYTWSNDEFYDADVLARGTPFTPQECDGQACVEPLLRMVSRFDWAQRARLDVNPDDPWPVGYYGGEGQPDLDVLCGEQALSQDIMDARTDGQVTAFVTHKYEDQKPSQIGDVVLGFDPYRFDHATMQGAVRWVLGEHFGLTLNP